MLLNSDLDKDEIIDEPAAVIIEDVTPKDLLRFAKIILGVLALLFVFGSIIDLVQPNSHVFEACKTILPPISTLVIGYYFGKSSN